MNITAVFFLLFFISIATYILILYLNKTKLISKNNLYSKIKVYTLIEFIYSENKMVEFTGQLDNKKDNIQIPTSIFYKNLILKFKIKLLDNWQLFSGLFFIFLFASIVFVRIPYFSLELY